MEIQKNDYLVDCAGCNADSCCWDMSREQLDAGEQCQCHTMPEGHRNLRRLEDD